MSALDYVCLGGLDTNTPKAATTPGDEHFSPRRLAGAATAGAVAGAVVFSKWGPFGKHSPQPAPHWMLGLLGGSSVGAASSLVADGRYEDAAMLLATAASGIGGALLLKGNQPGFFQWRMIGGQILGVFVGGILVDLVTGETYSKRIEKRLAEVESRNSFKLPAGKPAAPAPSEA